MQDITIYTALGSGVSIRGEDESCGETCFMGSLRLFLVCLAISVCLVVPILGIVFSQVYPWQEDGSLCDPKNPVKCTCHEEFPMYMLVGGVLYIIFVISWMGFTFGVAGKHFDAEKNTKRYVLISAWLVTIALTIVMALMAQSFLSSDRKCGESLSQYGGIMFAFFIIMLVSNLYLQMMCAGAGEARYQ
jgi:hypothetical protein